MSFLDWVLVSLACLLIFLVGYSGVTGKSLFSSKDHKENNHRKHH